MSEARLKHFGWGREGEGLTAEEEAFVIERAQARFGTTLEQSASAPRLEDIALQAPRVTAPASLAFCTSEHYDRAAHTYGKSYPELVRGLARDYASAPDVVAYPHDETEVKAVLEWAGGVDATVTPFGGGSSVCGGVEPRRNGHKGAVTIDLRRRAGAQRHRRGGEGRRDGARASPPHRGGGQPPWYLCQGLGRMRGGISAEPLVGRSPRARR